MMRIITGSARGVRLETLAGDATRPTAERTKEALFSALQFSIEGRRVLDLFAGSGQLGLEALSRGAEKAWLIDSSRDAVGVITRNAERTRLAERTVIQRAEALSFLAGYRGEPFHMIFLDPPYAAGLLPECLRLISARNLLTVGGIVVAESAREQDVFAGDDALRAGFEVLKATRYGAAFVTILSNREKQL